MGDYIDKKSSLTQSYYDVLEVSPLATLPQIKAAYKHKLLNAHPDKIMTTTTDNADERTVNLIQDSYKILLNLDKRAEYDEMLKKSIQKQGFNINGDGLDVYSLEDFEIIGDDEHEEAKWLKDCPRCTFPKSITLTEKDLTENGTDDGQGGFDIIVQCETCSLWIKVKYFEAEEQESDN